MQVVDHTGFELWRLLYPRITVPLKGQQGTLKPDNTCKLPGRRV